MTARAASLWLILAISGFVALSLALGHCTQEDAFISFRYAANLVDGHGLVFNPGERVEGYTNFLWTLTLASAIAGGLDPVPTSRILGILAGCALLATVFFVARRGCPVPATRGAIAVAVLAASPALAGESVQGLETVPFALLLTWSVVAATSGHAAFAGVCFGLSAMTRPEGIGVLVLTLAGNWLYRRGRAIRVFARSDALMLGTFLAVWLPSWIWRFAWYGKPLPNTFYAKTGGGWDHVVQGIRYAWNFGLEHPVLVLLLGLTGAFLRHGRRTEPNDDPLPTVAVVVASGYATYVVAVGGDFKDTWRFFLPFLPLLAILVDSGLARAPRALVLLATAAVVANGALAAPPAFRWAGDRALDLAYRESAGRWLGRTAKADATLAIHSCGIVPYYSGLRTIDMWGLNDPHIAHREMPEMGRGLVGHEKTDPAYVFGREPDYYVDEYVWVTNGARPGLAREVADRLGVPRIAEDYRARSVRLNAAGAAGGTGFWFTFLERIPRPHLGSE